MLFNSISFAIFLPVVFCLYWFFAKNLRSQNIVLFLASYVFYGFWDWRFLFLLIFSTLLDYFSAIKIEDSGNARIRRIWFWLSILVNLSFLGVFKYFNFFSSSFAEMLASVGLKVDPWLINVILPVGISFYTFHGLSYIIDIYKQRIKAERAYIDYSVFVCFFPLLVAGPIERATHLLPQIKTLRRFDYFQAVDGLKQILWGLFKKIVIADNCARFVNVIFSNYPEYNGSTLFLGGVFFAFQIYGDFSGYSDIALGTARLFGINLLRNFAFPYFSRDIAEFWRRWHISLSSWFRDYLYIPLGGSKGSSFMKVRNVFIIFLVSGFWHGPNWTFIAWGFLNALCIMPAIFFKTNRTNLDTIALGHVLPSLREFLQMLSTFTITTFLWIVFRSDSISDAVKYIRRIFSTSFFEKPSFEGSNQVAGFSIMIILFFLIEWYGRERRYAIESLFSEKVWAVRWSFYSLLIFITAVFTNNGQNTFIYFQF